MARGYNWRGNSVQFYVAPEEIDTISQILDENGFVPNNHQSSRELITVFPAVVVYQNGTIGGNRQGNVHERSQQITIEEFIANFSEEGEETRPMARTHELPMTDMIRAQFVELLNRHGWRRQNREPINEDYTREYNFFSFDFTDRRVAGNTERKTKYRLISFDELQVMIDPPPAAVPVPGVEIHERDMPKTSGSKRPKMAVTRKTDVEQDGKFNLDQMSYYVKEILTAAGLPTEHSYEFVKLAIERKSRFYPLDFDEFGRRAIPFTVTPQILLNDYTWFRVMLEEMNITKEALTVVTGKVFVLTDRGGGAPLTKELSKRQGQLFARGTTWHKSYEYMKDLKESVAKSNANPDVTNKLTLEEAFLKRLGDVINLGKKAVISINPGDILRKSMGGKYSAYVSCHDLANGAYRQGPVSYALDPSHMVTYITDGGDSNEKMHGRSMMVVSNDLNVVAMRRFYPSPEIFGESRARAIREEVHKLIAPDVVWKKSASTDLIQPSMPVNGYMDGIAVATYADPDKKFADTALCKDIFCFGCGRLHQNPRLMCGHCGVVQQPVTRKLR